MVPGGDSLNYGPFWGSDCNTEAVPFNAVSQLHSDVCRTAYVLTMSYGWRLDYRDSLRKRLRPTAVQAVRGSGTGAATCWPHGRSQLPFPFCLPFSLVSQCFRLGV